MLVAYLVEALWFPGQTFSNGQFSCRVAPLCLLGLEVNRYSNRYRYKNVLSRAVVGRPCGHELSLPHCFRPVSDPQKWMHGAGESACAFGSCPQKPPNGLDAVEDMGAAWCVSTPIDLSIYLSVSINMFFHFTYLFKDRYIKIFFNSSIFGHYCATNHRSACRIQCLLGRNSERWIAAAMAPNYTGFCKLSNLYVMAQRY